MMVTKAGIYPWQSVRIRASTPRLHESSPSPRTNSASSSPLSAEIRPHLRRDSALPRRIKEIFARNRAIGSRDRKLYRELIYTYLRFLPWIDPLP